MPVSRQNRTVGRYIPERVIQRFMRVLSSESRRSCAVTRRSIVEGTEADMQIHDITAAAGRLGPNRKRLGRGIGSGQGKTSGRGHKGAGSRSGTKSRLGHEGGQMPLFRRVAKRGFSSGDYSAQKFVAIVNVGSFARLPADVDVVTLDALSAAGIIPRQSRLVRVLGGGELNRVFRVEVGYVSRSALEKIEAAGGKAVLI